MQQVTTTRLAWGLLLAVLAVSMTTASGCRKASGPAKVARSSSKDATSTESIATPSSEPTEVVAARKSAQDFLAALTTGKAGPALLSVSFKKLNFRPFYDEEKAVGYSDSDAAKWLAEQGKGISNPTIDAMFLAPSNDQAIVRGTLTGPKGKEGFSLRLARVNASNTWLIDRWSRGPAERPTMPPGADAAVAFARENACDFLDTLLMGDLKFAGQSVSQNLKSKIAPPAFESDKKLGYSPGDLERWLKDARQEWKTYAITQQMASGKDSASFVGEMVAAGKKTPFMLRIVRDNATGLWQVDDFSVQ